MKNNINEILEKLFSFHRFGIKPGLERIYKLCEFLGNPQNNFKSIHIAGTNGKGSISSCIASILIESGFKTGLYTSPHINKFNERIQINGKMISDEEIVILINEILDYSEKINATFFDITTVLAFYYFSKNNVDFAIIETGMGGRYDSTNIINPSISIISKISLDHTEYLGNNLETITQEKAGIIKPKTPLVISNNDYHVNEILYNKANQENSPIIKNNLEYKFKFKNFTSKLSQIVDFYSNQHNYTDLEIILSGNHQIDNTISVLNAIDILNDYYDYKISEKNIRAGLKNVKENTNLFGRIELISEKPPIIIDVSHNDDGIKMLVDTIKSSPYKDYTWEIIFSALDDKNIDKMIGTLSNIKSNINIIQLNTSRAAKLDCLLDISKKYFINPISSPNTKELINDVLEKQTATIVCGSFYLINEFLEIYEEFKKTNLQQ